MNALPVHPFTGLTAIGILPSGKIVWPVMGGNGEGDDNADDGTKPNGGDDAGKTFTQDDVNKIVNDRLARERAATSEKYKDYDAFKASHEELAQFKEANKSEQEKALDTARKEAADAATKAALASVGEKLVGAAFTAAFAGRIETERATAIVGSLDKKSFLTADGEVDTEKVKSLVDSLAPSKGGANNWKPGDTGQGGAGSDAPKGGVASGAEKYAQRHAKKS